MFTLFSHIGIIVNDLESAVSMWTDIFGLKLQKSFTVEEEGVRSAIVSTGGDYGESTCVELIEPIDHDDLSHRIARRLTESGNRLAFPIAVAAAAAEQLRAAGLTTFLLPRAGAEATRRIVVHPRASNCVLLELLADRDIETG